MTILVAYLRAQWTQKEEDRFVEKLRGFEKLVVEFPELYEESTSEAGMRRAVITKHNSIIYQVDQNKQLIKVYTIFDNRRCPDEFR